MLVQLSQADIEAQTLRSSRVSLILPEEVQDQDCDEDDADDDADESEDEEAPVTVPQRVEQNDSGDVRNSRGRVIKATSSNICD